MSFLSDLLANARNTKLVKNSQQAIQNYETDRLSGSLGHEGSWGSKDRGYTELFTDIFKPGQNSADGGSDFFPNDTNTGIDAVATGDTYGPSLDEILASASPTGTTTTTTTDPATDDGTTALASALALARDQARIVAQQGYDRARGIWDEGQGLLTDKMAQFQNIFDVGQATNQENYQGEKGNLLRTAGGAGTKLRNSLRALGLGGSAFERGQGRIDQQTAISRGNLASNRAANDRVNTQGYQNNQAFINTQGGALDRYLQDASNAASSANTSTDIGYLEGISSLFSNIQARQDAINVATGNYASAPASTDYSGILEGLNLNPNLSGVNSSAQTNQATNLGNENLTYLEKLKRGLL